MHFILLGICTQFCLLGYQKQTLVFYGSEPCGHSACIKWYQVRLLVDIQPPAYTAMLPAFPEHPVTLFCCPQQFLASSLCVKALMVSILTQSSASWTIFQQAKGSHLPGHLRSECDQVMCFAHSA